MSCQKVVHNIFFVVAKLIGKYRCGSLFLINLQSFSLKETPARRFSYVKDHSG